VKTGQKTGQSLGTCKMLCLQLQERHAAASKVEKNNMNRNIDLATSTSSYIKLRNFNIKF